MSVPSKKNRIVGCLIGLAVGDAYGTKYEFRKKEQMPTELPDEILGGGPFNLQPGNWTDDTSMALCIADSILEKGWDAEDQINRFIKWYEEGYNSVTGKCFDIGHATSNALLYYKQHGSFIKDKKAGGNGVLMRLAPIPMFLHDVDCVFILSACAMESFITHPSSESIECSMLLGAILNKIFNGERDKEKILNFDTLLDENEKQMYKEVCEEYDCVKNDKIEAIKNVSYKNYTYKEVFGFGYCVSTLEAALWAFLSTDDFESGLKLVVSLGEDTDSTGAVYGQIAGAYYGLENIKWKSKISWAKKIHDISEKLYNLNLNNI